MSWVVRRVLLVDLGDAVVDGVSNETGDRRRRQLLREVLAVCVHRAQTHAECGGDFLACHSGGDAREHFAFSSRERRELRGRGGGSIGAGHELVGVRLRKRVTRGDMIGIEG